MPTCHNDVYVDASIVIYAYPGEDFTLRLALVGTMNGITYGTIHATIFPDSTTTHFGALQETQIDNNASCKDFTYTLFSTKDYAILILSTVTDKLYLLE